jgi:flagellar assembly protein FliH
MTQPFAFDQFAPAAAGTLTDPIAIAAAEVEALRVAAIHEGFAQGHADAVSAVQPAVAALEAAGAALEAERVQLAERLEGDAVELALAIAERIVAGAVAVDPSLVIEAVRGALRGIPDRERITVLVNPEDLGLVREASDGLVSSLGGIEHFEVQAERRVARGGVIVRHPEGDVDATIATKLTKVRELFEEEL